MPLVYTDKELAETGVKLLSTPLTIVLRYVLLHLKKDEDNCIIFVVLHVLSSVLESHSYVVFIIGDDHVPVVELKNTEVVISPIKDITGIVIRVGTTNT